MDNDTGLNHDEFLRLQALAQANADTPLGASAEQTIEKAARFEAYLRDGNK